MSCHIIYRVSARSVGCSWVDVSGCSYYYYYYYYYCYYL